MAPGQGSADAMRADGRDLSRDFRNYAVLPGHGSAVGIRLDGRHLQITGAVIPAQQSWLSVSQITHRLAVPALPAFTTDKGA